ncbi:MAG TPA: HAMP domain-containing protein, partial [Burkholderiaceae bacterium]|nr:HAMP domain-containing protein [Burkholderiaceae bacterium]
MNVLGSLSRLSIRSRLYFSTAFSLALLVAIGAGGYLALSHTRGTLQSLVEQDVAAMTVAGELRTLLAQVRRIEKDMIINFNNTNEVDTLKQAWLQDLDRARQQLQGWGAGREGGELARQALQSLQAYEEGIAPVIAQLERAQIDGAAAGGYAGRVQEHIEAADHHMAALASALRAKMDAARQAIDARAARVSALLAGAIVAAVLVLAPLTVATVRGITASLEQAGALARRIAEGDLSHEVPTGRRHDEIGRLVESMGRMQGALRRLVAQLQAAAQQITTASSEIAAGSQDLSSRTEQAASSLQQTASSMEQLTGTVRQSADAARQANQLASS